MPDFGKITSPEAHYLESVTSPDDILGQLDVSQEQYTDALSKLREGNLDDLDYLQEMKKNLSSFRNAFDIKFGFLQGVNKEIYDRTSARLTELNSALEKAGL